MSEEHDSIDIEKYLLPPGKWRIRYYKKVKDQTQWREEHYELVKPTALKELMLNGYKMGSCWQIP